MIIPIMLGVIGAAMGSFVGALVWRLHTKRDFVSDRSECENCHHKLGALDLVPIFSWLALRGKCRYCGAAISWESLAVEITVAALFVASYFFWPLGFEHWQAIASFGIWLVYIVMLGALFLYDLKWMLLLDKLVFPLIVLGFIDAALRTSLLGVNYVLYVALGVAVLAGIYGVLYFVSKGKWVGFGDVKIGIFMGAVLGWQGAFLTLFLANIIGLLVVAPGLALGKLNRKSKVPFGPFLIIAFVIAGLFGHIILTWYLRDVLFMNTTNLLML